MAALRSRSAMSLRKYVLREVVMKTLLRASQPQVLEEVWAVFRVVLAETQRPGTARRQSDSLDVKGRDGAARHQFVLEQIPVEELLYRDHAPRGRMRHGEELATATHPDIPGGVSHRRVKQRHVGANRRQQHD